MKIKNNSGGASPEITDLLGKRLGSYEIEKDYIR